MAEGLAILQKKMCELPVAIEQRSAKCTTLTLRHGSKKLKKGLTDIEHPEKVKK